MKRIKRQGKKPSASKAQQGLDRAKHFAEGGSLVEWNGGPRTVQTDRKKRASKRACRGQNAEQF